MEAVTIDNLAKAVRGEALKGDKNGQINKVIIDSRAIAEGGVFFAVKGENTDGHLYINQAIQNGAKAVVVHNDIDFRDIDSAVIKVTDTTQALLDFCGYYRSLFDIKVIAVTGSSGKTTTKDIISSVLSQKYATLKTQGNFNNQTGMPQTIFNLNSHHEMAVIEMGMSREGEIYNMAKAIKPDMAVITNIGYSHIEYLKTRENILKAKMEITSFFGQNNTLLVNADDFYLQNISSDDYKIIKTGIQHGDIKVTDIAQSGNGCKFKVDGQLYTFPLIGLHNVYNCLYAITIAKIYGLSDKDIQKGFDTFKPSSNRMDISVTDGITVINDVYNSNPQAARAALDVLAGTGQGRKIAVLADMLELGGYSKTLHEEIGSYAAAAGADILIAIGKEAKYIYNSALGEGIKEAEYFPDNPSAAEYLKSLLLPGDTVLFKGSRGMKLETIIKILFPKEN